MWLTYDLKESMKMSKSSGKGGGGLVNWTSKMARVDFGGGDVL